MKGLDTSLCRGLSPGGAGGAKNQVRWACRQAGLCGGGFLSTFLVPGDRLGSVNGWSVAYCQTMEPDDRSFSLLRCDFLAVYRGAGSPDGDICGCVFYETGSCRWQLISWPDSNGILMNLAALKCLWIRVTNNIMEQCIKF